MDSNPSNTISTTSIAETTNSNSKQCETSHECTVNKGNTQINNMKKNRKARTSMPICKRNTFHNMMMRIGKLNGQCNCSDDYQMIMQPLRYTWASKSRHVYETGSKNTKRKQLRIILKKKSVVKPLYLQEESSDEKYKF